MISVTVDEFRVESFMKLLIKKVGGKEKKTALLNDIGSYMVGSTLDKINQGVPPPNSPLTVANKRNALTLRDTGALMASITYQVLLPDQVKIGTNRPYAPSIQLGATIRPKQAQKLAIPAGWKTRSLMRRYGLTVRKCLQGLKQDGWNIWFTDHAIMGRKGKGKPQVLFVRKDSVKIPPRPFLYIDEADKKKIMQIAFKHLGGR